MSTQESAQDIKMKAFYRKQQREKIILDIKMCVGTVQQGFAQLAKELSQEDFTETEIIALAEAYAKGYRLAGMLVLVHDAKETDSTDRTSVKSIKIFESVFLEFMVCKAPGIPSELNIVVRFP